MFILALYVSPTHFHYDIHIKCKPIQIREHVLHGLEFGSIYIE